MRIQLIFVRKDLHLAPFWKWRFIKLGNDLFQSNFEFDCKWKLKHLTFGNSVECRKTKTKQYTGTNRKEKSKSQAANESKECRHVYDPKGGKTCVVWTRFLQFCVWLVVRMARLRFSLQPQSDAKRKQRHTGLPSRSTENCCELGTISKHKNVSW